MNLPLTSKTRFSTLGGRFCPPTAEAFYTFSKTGRNVHNKIDAHFEFKNGKIYRHYDDFDLWAWSRQALGLSGFLLGYTTFFKKKLQSQTRKLLTDYMQRSSK